MIEEIEEILEKIEKTDNPEMVIRLQLYLASRVPELIKEIKNKDNP